MKTALVLAGGGSRGAYQIGAWQALREIGITVDIVTGTSVGALNGALIAQNSFSTALAVWKALDTQMVFDISGKPTFGEYAKEFLKKKGASANGLKTLLEEYLAEDLIRQSPIELGLVTVKKKGLEPLEVYTEEIPKGQLNDYLLASAACYPAVKSHLINETEYIDGGYYDNMPIHLAEKKGADRMIVINLESVGLLKNSVKALKEAKNVTYISPKWDLGNFLVFEQKTIKRNIRLGYLDTLKAFGFFDGNLYTFAKHEFSQFAKKKAVTLKKWKTFFTSARLSGNLLHQAGYAALEAHLKSLSQKPLVMPVILETAAELTGKILEVDPLVLYNPESFHNQLSEKAKDWFLEKEVAELLKNYDEKSFSPKARWLKKLDSKTATLFFASVAKTNPEFIFPVATLFPKESIAGMYLNIFDLL